MIITSVLSISACIKKFHIFSKPVRNVYSLLKVLSLVKKSEDKSVNWIMSFKSIKNQHNSKYFIFFSSNTNVFLLCLCLFRASILGYWETSWIVLILHSSIFFFTNDFGNNFNFSLNSQWWCYSKLLFLIQYENFIIPFWLLFVVLNTHIVRIDKIRHKFNASFFIITSIYQSQIHLLNHIRFKNALGLHITL